MRARGEREKRQLERYRLTEDIYICFVPEYYPMAIISDINLRGVACEYLPVGGQAPAGTASIDIFSLASHLHITRIACRVAYDVALDRIPSLSPSKLHRCGLQFQGVTGQQLRQLANLIRHCRSRRKTPDANVVELTSPRR